MRPRPGSVRLRDYSVFGLRIRSELKLPELFRAETDAVPDVTIRLGDIDANENQPGLHALDDALLFVVADIGRYRVADGRDILVEPQPGVPERNLRLYLLGSVFGVLLHQRELLPLHANAIEIDGKAVAFMGSSGGGKSTLAARFHDRGNRVVADDICVVKVDSDDQAYALPGLPRLRLWQEALEASGRQPSDFERSYVGDENWNKFDVPIRPDTATDRELELGALYLLGQGEEIDIRRLDGIDAAEALFAHTYRGAFLAATNGGQSHWSSCMRLVRSTPVYCFTRPWDLTLLHDHVDRIFEHVRRHARSYGAQAVQR
jgi:hypothetical protein